MPILCFKNYEVFIAEIDVKLVVEVGREKNRNTGLLSESWEPCDSKIFFPLHLLTTVFISF